MRCGITLQCSISLAESLWPVASLSLSQGFLSGDEATANAFFTKASTCFTKAVEQEPGNDSYRRAKEMSAKVGWVAGVHLWVGGG